jgi:hypothetical protein
MAVSPGSTIPALSKYATILMGRVEKVSNTEFQIAGIRTEVRAETTWMRVWSATLRQPALLLIRSDH